jgi:BlaI family transcriptional regulator, penicillinase repressor
MLAHKICPLNRIGKKAVSFGGRKSFFCVHSDVSKGEFYDNPNWSKMNNNLESYILTRRELQIMKVIWERESATVKEVHAALTGTGPISRNTVLTLIRILEQKGALVHRRAGRSHLFQPVLSRQQALRNQIRDVIARFFDGAPERLIESIIENEIKTAEQLGSAKHLVQSKSITAYEVEIIAQ